MLHSRLPFDYAFYILELFPEQYVQNPDHCIDYNRLVVLL
jgi:hypothetical protein